jgi:group II intron reverse transcriptase/maturase
MRYRHQPIRRAYVDKEGGKKRQIGISTTEDKIVQDSLRELLEAVYEQDFLDCSYGFRPGRRAHDALRVLDRAVTRGEVNWVLEADIVSFFDRIDRKRLKELLQERLADKSLMRLTGTVVTPETGTVQGSTLSPMLANIYLHHALDLWFENGVKPWMRGRVILLRYCDDFVMGFERQEEAERVMAALGSRLGQFGLELHPGKTRLVDFRRPPPNRHGKGSGTFDFLGFTMLWKRSRRGRWYMATQTRVSSLRRANKAVYDECRRQRHLAVKEQHAALVRRIRGHFNYFGVRGNERRLALIIESAKRSWYKWLRRRSQRTTLTWPRFVALLGDYPLPQPKATQTLWGAAS